MTLERLGGLVGGGRRVGEGDGLRAQVVQVGVLPEEERLRRRGVKLLAAHDEVRGEVRPAVLGRVSASSFSWMSSLRSISGTAVFMSNLTTIGLYMSGTTIS